MDTKTITADYVSKYLSLLNKLNDNKGALASLNVSILCSQRNENNKLNENESPTMGTLCQYCFTPWKHGKYVLKIRPKHSNKNGNLQKKRSTAQSSFIMAMKCLVCSKETNSVFNKNKKLKRKSTEKKCSTSTHTKKLNKKKVKIVEEENKVDTLVKKKPKKKKRNLYAGLNPLVFKNSNLCKKKNKKPLLI